MSVEENIAPGKILCLNVCFPHESEPNDKFFVVVGFNERPLLLKINSEIKMNKIMLRLRMHQYDDFLKHDSYLDCSNVWYLLTKDEIIEQISRDSDRVIGDLIDGHKNQVVVLTHDSKSISRINKRAIREALT